MYKKFLTALLLAALVAITVACSPQETVADSEAYLMVFQANFSSERLPFLRGNYIAIDLSKVLYENPNQIKEVIENYLNGSDIVLLWENMDGLIKGGYLPNGDGYSENVRLFIYRDISLTETKLETEIEEWAGNLYGHWDTYTVEKKSNTWKITKFVQGPVS